LQFQKSYRHLIYQRKKVKSKIGSTSSGSHTLYNRKDHTAAPFLQQHKTKNITSIFTCCSSCVLLLFLALPSAVAKKRRRPPSSGFSMVSLRPLPSTLHGKMTQTAVCGRALLAMKMGLSWISLWLQGALRGTYHPHLAISPAC
jgi:hypothetical protein